MSIESLKQQARKHEQKEEWGKALEQYNRALAELARDEQADIGLYNRVGDLYVRVGDLDSAVEHYNKAVELYREAYLPNNAIAVCKKIIRNVPDRHQAYLLIGQIRAEQGFIPDARTNFLTYAERMAQSGDLDESFRALVEFCDLAPDDVGVRLSVVDQMIASDRQSDAIEQLKIVRAHYLRLGNQAQADDVESRILNLDPAADLSAVSTTSAAASSPDSDFGMDFGEITLGDPETDDASEDEISLAPSEPEPEPVSAVEDDGSEDGVAVGDFSIDADDEEGVELPMMEIEGADPGEADALPTFDVGDEDLGEAAPALEIEAADDSSDFEIDAEEEAEPLPTMDFGEDEEAVGLPIMEPDEDIGPAELPGLDEAPAAVEEAFEEVASDRFADPAPEPTADESPLAEPDHTADARSDGFEIEAAPADDLDEAAPDAPAMESAVDAPAPEPTTEAAGRETGDDLPVESASPEPAEAPPSGGGDSYVDFGAMILGDSAEKSTRFTVAYQEPSGDEEADFAKMLAQFKDKVSENLDTDDVRAHYDLGTAYKEMGLLDEAISSFQAALRASADHLPTYELMGQTFMEMGQTEAAVRTLERALRTADTVEDELVGIYYYLGRAYEELENRDSAVEYYDRVFSLDINFADVTERLRELR